MDCREAKSEIFFDDEKMAQVSAAEIPAGVAIACFINRTEIGREFFIGNVY